MIFYRIFKNSIQKSYPQDNIMILLNKSAFLQSYPQKCDFGVHGDAPQGGARGCTPNNKHIKYILTKRATRARHARACSRVRVDWSSQALFLHSGRAGLNNGNGHLMTGHPLTSECLAK